MKIWAIRKDGRMVLTHFHEMKKENEIVRDFNEKFDKLIKQFHSNLKTERCGHPNSLYQ
jgi:hypothetical protein